MRFRLKANRGRRIVIIVRENEVEIVRKKYGNACGEDLLNNILVFKENKEKVIEWL